MRTSLASPFALAIFSLLLLPATAFASTSPSPWQWNFQAPEASPTISTDDECDSESATAGQASSERPEMARVPRVWSTPSSRITRDRKYVVEYSVVEEDGKPYLLERRRELKWTWNYPRYVGLLGMEFSGFTKLSHKNGAAGMFYRHLNSQPGPLFYGFELTPFSFGAVYDQHDFTALYSFQTRALGLLRFYFGSAAPTLYFELGAGLQYVAFKTADDFAVIYENGYPRDEFSRWRGATRLAMGIEIGAFGLEVGWTGIFPVMKFEYAADTAYDEITNATVSGLVYLTATFRVGHRN